jgi:hypothetical protein
MTTSPHPRPAPFAGPVPRRTFAATLLLLAAGAAPAAAQLIPIRTVPVSQSHQFEIFPSHSLGMGGVSIALRDSLLDPFSNPAAASRLRAPLFTGSPALYSVTSGAGGGRSLPLGAVGKAGPWYGGVLLALQQVDLSQFNQFGPITSFVCPNCISGASGGIEFPQVERTQGNSYAFGMAGRDLSPGLSVGGSVMWADLNAVDGVDLLYAGSARIKQFGSALDLRLGMVREWSHDHALEAVVLHNRFDMTHDVYYLDAFWNPNDQRIMMNPRLEQNLDQSNTWGLHLAYQRPLTDDGWRVGGIVTTNLKTHPKIPNYEIMNIPRDPGHSAAFNLGAGVSRIQGSTTFGIDVVYEPIWSHTWSDSESPTETQHGAVIPPGGKIIENDFRFSNALFRMGLNEDLTIPGEGGVLGLQLGLVVRPIRYWLTQRDNVQSTSRNQTEHWVEWTPTWGLAFRRPTLEIRYRGSITNGTGRPGVAPAGGFFRGGLMADAALGSNLLVAPSGPLTLDPVQVHAHQFSISVPVR